jgi:hypothetical protein
VHYAGNFKGENERKVTLEKEETAMSFSNTLGIKCGLSVLIISMLMLAAPSAFAQQAACVHLLVGAGYAAWMRVVSGNYASEWSDSFPIGQTRCQSLAAIGDGQPFTVQVSAVLGSSKVPCNPPNIPRVAASTTSVTFQAWGTTLNVNCEMPSVQNAKSMDTSTTPSKEGLKALEKVQKEGARLKAPK